MCCGLIFKLIFNSVCIKPYIPFIIFIGSLHVFIEASRALIIVQTMRDLYREPGDSSDGDVDNSSFSFAMSIITAVSSTLEFLGNPLWGHFSDHIGRRPILFFSLFIRALGSFFLLPNQSLWPVVICVSIMSICHPHFMMMQAVIYDCVPDELMRQKKFGYLFAGYIFAGFGGVIFWTVAWDRLEQRQAYAILFLLFLIEFVLFIFFFGESNEDIWIKFTGSTWRVDKMNRMISEAESQHSNQGNPDEMALSPGLTSEDPLRNRSPEGPRRLSTEMADRLIDQSLENTTKNPFLLLWRLKDEPEDLRNAIILRVGDAFNQALWTACALPLTKELFDMELVDLLPLMVLNLVLSITGNALMPCWTKCMSYTNLFKYSIIAALVGRFLRAFMFKKVGRFGNLAIPYLVFTAVCTYPFGELTTVMIVGVMTMFIDEKKKGTTLGAVESAVQVSQILANSGGLALTGLFLRDDITQHFYYPTVCLLISFLVTIPLTYIGIYKVVPPLREFKKKEQERQEEKEAAIRITQEEEDIQMSAVKGTEKRAAE